MKTENILRYLKIPAPADAQTLALIAESIPLAVGAAVERSIFNIYPVTECEDGVFIEDVFFPGAQIKRRLSGCEMCALMAVTLGVGCDGLIRKYSAVRPSMAAVLQAVFADMTEDLCDKTEQNIQKTMPGFEPGLRFSPGYPGLGLEMQTDIFKMLDITRRIGITLTDSYLMIPTKSVTAFVGLRRIEK